MQSSGCQLTGEGIHFSLQIYPSILSLMWSWSILPVQVGSRYGLHHQMVVLAPFRIQFSWAQWPAFHVDLFDIILCWPWDFEYGPSLILKISYHFKVVYLFFLIHDSYSQYQPMTGMRTLLWRMWRPFSLWVGVQCHSNTVGLCSLSHEPLNQHLIDSFLCSPKIWVLFAWPLISGFAQDQLHSEQCGQMWCRGYWNWGLGRWGLPWYQVGQGVMLISSSRLTLSQIQCWCSLFCYLLGVCGSWNWWEKCSRITIHLPPILQLSLQSWLLQGQDFYQGSSF